MGEGGLLCERCSFGVVTPFGNLLVEITVLKMSPGLENRSRRRQWWCTGDWGVSRRCFLVLVPLLGKRNW